jgi:hypothetical protein
LDWIQYFGEASRLKTIWWLYPKFQLFPNDATERPNERDLEIALQQRLPLPMDDVEVHVQCDTGGFSEDELESDEEDEEFGDPFQLIEIIEDMEGEISEDDSDYGGWFPGG